DTRQVGAIGIYLEFHTRALRIPVIAHPSRAGQRKKDVLELRREPAEGANILCGLSCAYVGVIGDQDVYRKINGGVLQLPDVDARARNARRQDRLQMPYEFGSDFLVFHL